MDEHKHLRARTALAQRAHDIGVVDNVRGELARLDVEDEDEDGNAVEDVFALMREVAFHETVMTIYLFGFVLTSVAQLQECPKVTTHRVGIKDRRRCSDYHGKFGRLRYKYQDERNCDIPAAVPKIQCQIAHEFDVAMLHVYSSSEPSNVFCNIVAENH